MCDVQAVCVMPCAAIIRAICSATDKSRAPSSIPGRMWQCRSITIHRWSNKWRGSRDFGKAAAHSPATAVCAECTLDRDDRRLNRLAPQLRYLEIDLAGAGRQGPFITAGSGVLSSLAPLIMLRPTKLVCLGIHHGVEHLCHRTTNHLADMVSDPGLISLDHLPHRILVTRLLLLHCTKKASLPKCQTSRRLSQRCS